MTDNLNFLYSLFDQLLSILDNMEITSVGNSSISLLNILMGMFVSVILLGFFLGRRKYE